MFSCYNTSKCVDALCFSNMYTIIILQFIPESEVAALEAL